MPTKFTRRHPTHSEDFTTPSSVTLSPNYTHAGAATITTVEASILQNQTTDSFTTPRAIKRAATPYTSHKASKIRRKSSEQIEFFTHKTPVSDSVKQPNTSTKTDVTDYLSLLWEQVQNKVSAGECSQTVSQASNNRPTLRPSSTTTPPPAIENVTTSDDTVLDGRLVIDDGFTSNGDHATGVGIIQNLTFRCKPCDFSTTSPADYLKHSNTAHAGDFQILYCDLCEYVFKYKQNAEKLRDRHPSLRFNGGGLQLHVKSPNGSSSMPTMALQTSPCGTSLNSPNISENDEHHVKSPEGTSSMQSSPCGAHVITSENDEESGSSLQSPRTTPLDAAAPTSPKREKIKCVAPEKYFEVADEEGAVHYGCSICGNVFAWKKSLNKHWKDRHLDHPGNCEDVPPGMESLLKRGKHEYCGEARMCYDATLLRRMEIRVDCRIPAMPTNLLATSTPPNLLAYDLPYHRMNQGEEIARGGSIPYRW